MDWIMKIFCMFFLGVIIVICVGLLNLAQGVW